MVTQKTLHISIPVAVCLLVAFLAAVATQTSVHSWYLTLNKPFFTPPSWLFGPVWIVLYILMGVAAGLVWDRGFYHKWVKTALYHFAFQLVLNASWSIFFFGSKQIFPALLIITALFIFLLFTYRWFKVVNTVAAYLLIPYILWVGFATLINFEIWRLN